MCLCSCLGVCMFILCCLPISTEQSNLICSSQPIIALAGNDVILPCRLDPPTSASSKTVEWTKPGLDPEYIHVHQDGRLVYQSQNPLYNYRTRLFVDQLINGNVSMKIFGVKISDAGKYKCFLPWLWKEAFIQLDVGAVSPPIVSLAGTDKATRGLVLQCESKGWYPEPEVVWLDGEGNLLSAGPTETVRGPDDLYTVSSRVTVEKRHSNSFTCRVQQLRLKQTRATVIHVPEDFFMAPSSCTAKISISVVAVCLIFAAVGFALWKFKLNKTKTETNQEHKTDGETNTSKTNKTNRVKEKEPLMKTQTHPKKDEKVKSREKETKTTSSMDSDNMPADSNVIVDEVDQNGKFVRLKNKSSERQLLANWKVDIKVNKDIITYTLPAIFLDAGNMVTIWACDGGGNDKSPSDLVWKEQKSWGTVDEVTLKGPTGERRCVKKISHP